ncbi:MAG TPA: DUF2244 domain-containing protein [Caulobacteraceae bacterium]|nr:DUF2244 domain-containing protein [Caulobacteraceae bacterium]
MSARLYMDAVITPHRSLSRRGFYVLLGVLITFNVAMAIFFLTIGALPVPVFLGIDVLGVIVAFRVNYARAERAERVRVSADEVTVVYQAGRRAHTVWRSPTAFTGVAVDGEAEDDTRVRLKLSDRRLTVARALSPKERGDFAKALEDAIRSARAERY